MTSEAKEVGNQLRIAAKAAGYTGLKLAESLRTYRPVVSDWMNGKKPISSEYFGRMLIVFDGKTDTENLVEAWSIFLQNKKKNIYLPKKPLNPLAESIRNIRLARNFSAKEFEEKMGLNS